MFDISLRKVIIGSAVIGGVAVAGYYSYKWLTRDTSEKITEHQPVDNAATTEEPPINTTETEPDVDAVKEVAHVQKDDRKMAEKVGQVKNEKEMAATGSHANSTLENGTADGAKDAETTSGAEVEPNRGETVTAKRAVTVEDEHLGACGGSQSRKKAILEIIAAAAVDRLANLLPEEWSSKMRNESKD